MNQDKLKRVLRGGFWSANARWCRSAFRNASEPGYRLDGIGFRLAKTKIYPRTTRAYRKHVLRGC